MTTSNHDCEFVCWPLPLLHLLPHRLIFMRRFRVWCKTVAVFFCFFFSRSFLVSSGPALFLAVVSERRMPCTAPTIAAGCGACTLSLDTPVIVCLPHPANMEMSKWMGIAGSHITELLRMGSFYAVDARGRGRTHSLCSENRPQISGPFGRC